jgi:hypothetical protein
MADGGIPLIGVLGSLGSGLIGGISSYLGAQAEAGAIKNATKVQQQEYQQGLDLLQPSIDAGNTARGYQLGALGLPGGVDSATATAAFRNSPGYQFALKQGLNSAQTSAAANGSLFSGGTLKALNDFASGMADQNFGDWFNRVGGISGAGSSAAGQAINLGSSTAGNLSDLALKTGDNQASSYGGIGNAAAGSLQSLADLQAYYNPPGWKPYMAGGSPMNLTGAAYGR